MRIYKISSQQTNRWTAVELWKVSWSKSGGIKKERITGSVQIMPDPTHKNAALVLRPTEWIVAEDEEHRKRGILEYKPGSNMEFSVRTIVPLSKKEAEKAFTAHPGDELILKRTTPEGAVEYKLIKD